MGGGWGGLTSYDKKSMEREHRNVKVGTHNSWLAGRKTSALTSYCTHSNLPTLHVPLTRPILRALTSYCYTFQPSNTPHPTYSTHSKGSHLILYTFQPSNTPHPTYSSHSNTNGNLDNRPHALATRVPPRSDAILICSCSLHEICEASVVIFSFPKYLGIKEKERRGVILINMQKVVFDNRCDT